MLPTEGGILLSDKADFVCDDLVVGGGDGEGDELLRLPSSLSLFLSSELSLS